jgi:hypothetical protein
LTRLSRSSCSAPRLSWLATDQPILSLGRVAANVLCAPPPRHGSGSLTQRKSVSPQRGLYVVWLLQMGAAAWTLSVNMGTEDLAKRLRQQDKDHLSPRERRVLEDLRRQATTIRGALGTNLTQGWGTAIDLKSAGTRQRRYEAATILSRTYPLSGMPSDGVLRQDLYDMCVALQEANRAKRDLDATGWDTVAVSSPHHVRRDLRDPVFETGTEGTRTTRLPERLMTRSLRHEGGLKGTGGGSRREASDPRPRYTRATSLSLARRNGLASTRLSMAWMRCGRPAKLIVS